MAGGFGNTFEHGGNDLAFGGLDEIDQPAPDIVDVKGSEFFDRLHPLIGETGERAASILGALHARDQIASGEPVDALGESAL